MQCNAHSFKPPLPVDIQKKNREFKTIQWHNLPPIADVNGDIGSQIVMLIVFLFYYALDVMSVELSDHWIHHVVKKVYICLNVFCAIFCVWCLLSAQYVLLGISVVGRYSLFRFQHGYALRQSAY